jgi:hypothetical protein
VRPISIGSSSRATTTIPYTTSSDAPNGSAPQGSIRSPAAWIRPYERAALAGARLTFMGFRGSSEDRARIVAPALVWRSRQAVSAAIRYSCPYRESQTVVRDLASLNLACPFKAHRRSSPVNEDRLHPPGLCSPSALGVKRIRSTRACLARHLPSSAFLTLSTAYTPPHLSGLVSSR